MTTIELVGGPMDGATFIYDSYDPFVLVQRTTADGVTFWSEHHKPWKEGDPDVVEYRPDWYHEQGSLAPKIRATQYNHPAYRFVGYPRKEKV